jgi:hypothetical protein
MLLGVGLTTLQRWRRQFPCSCRLKPHRPHRQALGCCSDAARLLIGRFATPLVFSVTVNHPAQWAKLLSKRIP